MQRARAEQRGRDLIIHLDRPLNQDHLETVSGGQGEFYVDFEVADPRRARVQQRRLFFALLHDIETYFVVPSEFLKSMFYTQYEFYTAGKSISLSDTTKSSVSDANQLLDLVIDFMFEWRVPFKKGYELLTERRGLLPLSTNAVDIEFALVCSRNMLTSIILMWLGGQIETRVDHAKASCNGTM
jgi:hypothetical protein